MPAIDKARLVPFRNFLIQNGAEIIPITNEYEFIRFKGKEVGVVYHTGRFSNTYAKKAWNAYLDGKPWDGRPISTGRRNDYKKEKLALLGRDGLACFYCGELLGEDITLEHLIPLTSGGPNKLFNMVLAHEHCNNLAGFKPLQEKVMLAIKMRVEKISLTK